MKTIASYVVKEWKIWLAAVLLTIGLGAMPPAEASPVFKVKAEGVEFFQDFERNTWFSRYDTLVMNLDVSFDAIRILWKGKYKGRPLILIAGQQGPMCEMTMRLYWWKSPVQLSQYTDFGTCFAQKVTVSVKDNLVTVTLDGKQKVVELK